MTVRNNPFMGYFDCGGEYGYDFDVREYIPEHTGLVDLARFERLLALADAVETHWSAVRDYAMRYIAYDEIKDVEAIEDGLKGLRPGDRDPLP